MKEVTLVSPRPFPEDDDLFNFDFDGFEFSNPNILNGEQIPTQHRGLSSIQSIETMRLKKSSEHVKKKNCAKARKSLLSGKKVPNMSRKSQSTVLYAFPTFDKCDSLVFLPTMLSKYINSSDYSSVLNLLLSHSSKGCQVNLCTMRLTMDVARLVQVYEIDRDLHPDSLMCVHSTKVVGNTIVAVMYTKFTDSRVLYDGVAKQRAQDELYQRLIPTTNRLDRYQAKLQHYDKTAQESSSILSAAAVDTDLVGYANWTMTFTCDEYTRKITNIDFTCEVTSLAVQCNADT